jgi:hypothetical protein
MLGAGQDFLLPFSASSSATIAFLKSAGTDITPRVPRLMGKLVMADGGRGLLTQFSVAGHNLLVGDGFPLRSLRATARTGDDNYIGVVAGPNTFVELAGTYTVASAQAGYIGMDVPDPEILEAALDAIRNGELFGPKNWAWGLGEATAVHVGADATFSKRIPRRARLKRMVVECYPAAGTPAVAGLTMTAFKIAGEDMLARTGNLDVFNLLDDLNTDQDGLRINETIDTNDLVEITIHNIDAVNDCVVQIGFFTD